MKLDKETMIKQRFWFLLPVFAICLLVGWICVLGVRGETETNYSKARTKDKDLQAIVSSPELKNDKWIEAMNKENEVSTAKKDELWYREYDRQNRVLRDPKDRSRFERKEPFFTWPELTRSQWMKTSLGRELYNMDFGEFLGNIPSDEYRQEYPQQFENIASVIRDWLDESNPNNVTGAVRVIGASGNHRRYVIPTLLKPYPLNREKHILSDEIHLLQEDAAVKRELFVSLADLLDSYSVLKKEWNEVPFVDIKEAAAPAPSAPAAPPGNDGGTAVPPATPAIPAEPAAPKKDAEPEIYQRYRFYNYIWPNLLNTAEVQQNAKAKATTIELGLPTIDPYKGWRIDLTVGQDSRDEKKLVLRGTSGNHSSVFSLPNIPLLVWYSEIGSEREAAAPLVINDAGGVAPSEYWPNLTLKKKSEKTLKEIPIPANFGKITRVTRVLPENTIDQQIAFNNEWVVNVILLRRPNSPTLTLRGEIINRSGRRLPVATFSAGLSLPNTTNLLFEDFKVATDAFNAGERRTFVQEIRNPIQPRNLAVIKQKLNWRSTPIKRIDRLEIGRLAHDNSDRLKILKLIPYDFKRKDPLNQNTAAVVPVTPAEGDGSTGGGLEGTGASGGPPTAGGFAGGKGFGAGGSATDPVSLNQSIPLNRYVEVTNQLRRIPVALVMVVDATAITDIIAAMSNLRLRFQVTMAPWVKVQNLGRPGNPGTTASTPGGAGGRGPGGGDDAAFGLPGGGGTDTGAGRGAPPPPMGGKGGMTPGGLPSGPAGGGVPPGGGNRPPSAPGAIGLEDDTSVVELQIYGIVTIYESPDNFKRIEQAKTNAPAAATPASAPAAPGK